jgi:hypothetical protein
VDPVRLHTESNIHMIVDDEQNPGLCSHLPEFQSQMVQILLRVTFLSELDYL